MAGNRTSKGQRDQEFLDALVRAGNAGRMVGDLAEILGCSQSSVRDRASRLRRDGLIETSYTEGFAFYSLSESAKANRRSRQRTVRS